MRTAHLRGAHDRLVERPRHRHLGAEPRDILLDRAAEQHRLLRDIAERAAQLFLRPIAQIRAVEPDHALRRGQHAHHRLDQRRLARTARPDHAQQLARPQRKADVANEIPVVGGRGDRQVLDRDGADRIGQHRELAHVAAPLEQLDDLPVGRARLDDVLPRAVDEFDWRQRARDQQRGGKDRTRRNLLLDRQQRAQPERQRLERKAHRLDIRPERRALEIGAGAQRDTLHPVAQVAAHHRLAHPQRCDNPGRTDRQVDPRIGHLRADVGLLDRLAGAALVQPAHHRQQQRADQRHRPQRGMDHEAHQNIDRRPRRVEQRQRAHPGHRLAERVEFAQHRRRPRALARHRGLEQRLEDVGGQQPVEPLAGADQQAGADQIEQRDRRDRPHEDQRQHRQRHRSARRHHPVIDLEHVQRRRQIEDVQEGAEDRGIDEMRTARRHRGADRRGGGIGRE